MPGSGVDALLIAVAAEDFLHDVGHLVRFLFGEGLAGARLERGRGRVARQLGLEAMDREAVRAEALGRRRYRKNVEPGGSRRRDTRFTANLGMSFRQSLAWTYDLDLMYVLNNSNANASSPSDQRFHETSIRFSMLWDIVP